MSSPSAAIRPLSILAPTRYPWRFNSPRRSRHHIEIRNFLPFNYLSPRVEGVTVFNPLPPRRFDLIHAFNRIPLGVTPFIIGFESHLPRAFQWEHSAFYRQMTRLLASRRCRGIFALSAFAQRMFLHAHAESPERDVLAAKLQLRYPNVVLPPTAATMPQLAPFRLVFVGNHFARKGGCVAVRLAELAHHDGFPLVVDIVSKLEVGGAIWTDPPQAEFFAPYLKLLDLPNVNLHRGMANPQVHELLRQAHLSLLPTFSDTFGYSAIESMVHGTPVLATAQGALPEFVLHDDTGVLLPLPTTPLGEWVHLTTQDRSTSVFHQIYRDEVERLATTAYGTIRALAAQPERLAAMRQRARSVAQTHFDPDDANQFWDTVYDRAAGNAATSAPEATSAPHGGSLPHRSPTG